MALLAKMAAATAPGDRGDYVREMIARAGDAERSETVAAWALMMRSPLRSWSDATSWLGGLPCGPDNLVWPRSSDGVRLHFLAQIDLAAVREEPGFAARPAGLPPTGALLVFIGVKEHSVMILSLEDLAVSGPVTVPADLSPIRQLGHWSDAATFDQWPVDLVAFLDDGADRPAAFPDPWSNPAHWIRTWAIAQAEADIVLSYIGYMQRNMAEFRNQKPIVEDQGDMGLAMRQAAYFESQQSYFRMIESTEFSELHATMIAWRDAVSKADPEALIDPVALEGLFVLRRRMAEKMVDDRLRQLLMGWHHSLWEQIRRRHAKAIAERQFDSIPLGLLPFVEAVITDYRGHKICGLSKNLCQNYEDRRGQDLLICVHSDEFLRTEMEHEYAISVWCARDGLAEGRYDSGQVIRRVVA